MRAEQNNILCTHLEYLLIVMYSEKCFSSNVQCDKEIVIE